MDGITRSATLECRFTATATQVRQCSSQMSTICHDLMCAATVFGGHLGRRPFNLKSCMVDCSKAEACGWWQIVRTAGCLISFLVWVLHMYGLPMQCPSSFSTLKVWLQKLSTVGRACHRGMYLYQVTGEASSIQISTLEAQEPSTKGQRGTRRCPGYSLTLGCARRYAGRWTSHMPSCSHIGPVQDVCRIARKHSEWSHGCLSYVMLTPHA